MRRVLVCAAVLLSACNQQAPQAPSEPTAETSNAPAAALTPADIGAFFDCLRENSYAVVSAHRGGPAPGFAENAIPTFEHTVSLAPAFLEVDVARTSDGALVLMHDDDVARTTDGRGLLADLTLPQVRALRLRDDAGAVLNSHPPTLLDALDWAEGRAVLELDVKRGVSYEDVAREVRAADAMGRVVFITYSVDGAARLARVAPEAIMYTTVETEDDIDQLQARGVNLAHVIAWTGTGEPNSALNLALAERGVEARFGTLGGRDSWDARFARNGRDEYAAFAETGVQIIATDRPAEAVRNLDANDGADGYAALQCAGAQRGQ